MEKTKDNFIMLPTVDFCFKELMQNPKVRKGFIAALPKLPGDVKSGKDIIQWMRFFNGKSQEEFEIMAKENEYFDEAYNALKKMSADDQKRLEYEAREKALRDYNTQINSALERGEKIGERRGIELTKQMMKLEMQGKSVDEIAGICGTTIEKVEEILN